MDPNATLQELRELAGETIKEWEHPETTEIITPEHYLLAQKIKRLDDWISNGGFVPTDWDKSLMRQR